MKLGINFLGGTVDYPRTMNDDEIIRIVRS